MEDLSEKLSSYMILALWFKCKFVKMMPAAIWDLLSSEKCQHIYRDTEAKSESQ